MVLVNIFCCVLQTETLCAINPSQSSSKKHYGWVIVSCEDPEETFVQFFSKNVLPEFRQELDGQDYDIDGYNNYRKIQRIPG